MERRALISVVIIVSVAALSSLLFYEMAIAHNTLGELGLLGIFLASLLSHLTVVARDMFVPLFLPLTPLYSPLLLGAIAGWGGALGEVTTYYFGWGISEAVGEDEESDGVADWIRRYGLLAILLVAATPLPDTPLILLAGSSRLSLPKLLFVEGVGKTLLYILGALLGGVLFKGMTGLLGSLVASAVIVVASTIFCLLASWKRGREAVLRWVKRSLS